MINAKAAGLAVGILWAVCLFIMTVVCMYKGYAAGLLGAIESMYPGYSITWGGAFVGLIYGFLDGFIGTVILVWIYNYFAKKL
ncbi:bacteriophage holin [Candidatus Woesearchaeota archaeon]|nr:bacteriophage holin [Candidatus Woesearchaeota archaeon]